MPTTKRSNLELAALTARDFDTLPPSDYGVPFNGAELLEVARTHRKLEARALEGGSRSESAVLEALTADMFACIARGKDADAVVELCRKKWLRHCEKTNRRIHQASKTRLGVAKGRHNPSEQWCSPAAFASRALFVMAMIPDEEPTVKVWCYSDKQR